MRREIALFVRKFAIPFLLTSDVPESDVTQSLSAVNVFGFGLEFIDLFPGFSAVAATQDVEATFADTDEGSCGRRNHFPSGNGLRKVMPLTSIVTTTRAGVACEPESTTYNAQVSSFGPCNMWPIPRFSTVNRTECILAVPVRQNNHLSVRHDFAFRARFLGMALVRCIRCRGASLATVSMGVIDLEDDAQELLLFMKWWSSKQERLAISRRTSDSMLRHQQNGRIMGGVIPFGFTRDPDDESRMIEDDHEQAAIAHIVELRESGLSCRAIARELSRSNPGHVGVFRGISWSRR